MNLWHEPLDRHGRRLRVGDLVRVVGVPDLSGMPMETRAETFPVFKFLKGKEQRIDRFDEFGFAWINFGIPSGKRRGWHGVAIEPKLLQRQLFQRRPNNKLQRTRGGSFGEQ
jgi:hypothetical protein